MPEKFKTAAFVSMIWFVAVGGTAGMAGVAYWVAHTEYKTEQPANVAPVPNAPAPSERPSAPAPLRIPADA